MKKIALWIAVTFIIISGGIFTLRVGIYFFFHDPSFHKAPFLAEQWISGDKRIKGQMLDDLIQRKIFKGKSKEEIISILGEPTFKHIGNPVMSDHPEFLDFTYEIDVGKKIGNHVWPHYLHILFDPKTNKEIDFYLAD